ncbi:hypothetical protein [Nocardiopsis sp. L17-MgMaSL7]|uniref:hypothetical protein n=1 Tax=Nocardiopsis sp. L17-MgMaSL7 TaxID=1938893 RepID=UPI000D71BCF9|nr:hypothetical protein [Nocardiopsis sp. L17-MgMaSL7]PWV45489.1 hypothetical protein BDW27_11750 [Nocardiopsis sp. L17-MgMaSL7]
MMALLRSRKLLYVLVGLVVVGLVVSGAIGLFQSFNSPPVATPGDGQGQQGPGQQGEQGTPPPDVGALDSPPSGFTYVDQDEAHCSQGQCFRLIVIAGEEGEELDGEPEEAVRAVYEHLVSHGWRQEIPPGAESEEDVELIDTVLTDDTTLVADSTASEPGALPVLMLGNAGNPAD